MARVEWLTVGVIAGCTGLWAATLYLAGQHGWWPLLVITVLCVTLHSSCQHEALHGHPTRSRLVNEALVFLAVGLYCPYRRFRTLHFQHHHNELLTDPYDDPESFYMAPADWARAHPIWRAVRTVNNTQVGRLVIGPALSIAGFWSAEARLMLAGDRETIVAWALHAAGAVPVLYWVVGVCGIDPLFYFFAVCYPAISVLSIRTFIEHQARLEVGQRTILNEDRGPLAFLFLNNNFHFVHHSHPGVAWYKLPGLFDADRAAYLAGNGHYHVRSYWEVLTRFAIEPKEPVEHPVMAAGKWRQSERTPHG